MYIAPKSWKRIRGAAIRRASDKTAVKTVPLAKAAAANKQTQKQHSDRPSRHPHPASWRQHQRPAAESRFPDVPRERPPAGPFCSPPLRSPANQTTSAFSDNSVYEVVRVLLKRFLKVESFAERQHAIRV